MAGINSLTGSFAGTLGPSVAMALWNIGAVSIPFATCGVLKISYDLTLYFMFKNVRPPEEVRPQPELPLAVWSHPQERKTGK